MDRLHKILYVLAGGLFVVFLPWSVYNDYFNEYRQGVSIVANNENQELTLEDGSTFNLQKGTELIHSKKFSSEYRKAELKGSAEIRIQKDVRPFIIKMKRFVLESNECFVVVSMDKIISGKINKGELVIKQYDDEGELSETVYFKERQSFELTSFIKQLN